MSFELTRARITPARALRPLDPGPWGGVALFLGRVRADRVKGGRVSALHYEAYPRIALREMARLEQEAKRRWDLGKVVVVHRLGKVPVGEVSVAVAVGARHREAALEACRFLIDALKRDVPIWKSDVREGPQARSGSRRRRPPSRRGARAAG